MNRAILIVICDFLVSAMLSMMTGMVPAHTGGTAAGLDEQTTRALLAEMHDNMSKLERTRELLREVIRKNGGATPEQLRQLHELARQIVALQRDTEMLKNAADRKGLANLTAKELQKRLEAELRQRKLAEMELKERSEDLAKKEQDLRDLRDNSQGMLASQLRINEDLSRTNAALAQQNADTSRKLAEANRELRETEKALVKETGRRELAEERLKDTSGDLDRTLGDLEKTRGDLEKTRGDLRNVGAQNTKNKTEAEKQRALARKTREKLNKSEEELARKKDETNRLEKEKKQLEVENALLKKNIEMQQTMVKNSLNEVRDTRKKLEETELKLAKAETEVKEKDETIKAQKEATKVAKTQLEKANKKPSNRVLQNYAAGVVRLTVDIREERMLGREVKGGGTFYLPLIEIGGKTFLVGYTGQFIGDDGNSSLSYRDVKTAVLFAAPPSEKRDAAVKTPVLLANAEPQLAAIPMTMKTRKPLRALTVNELREHGVDGLFLFKAGSPGNEYAELTGRCSIGLDGELVIRNSGSRSELRAEPGDLILTRSGEFVGIVVAAETASGSSRRGDQARAFVLPDGKVWNDAKLTITYTRPDGKKYFTDFEESVRKIRDTAPPTAPSRRRRHR